MKEDEISGPKELKKVKLDDKGDAVGKLKGLDEKGKLPVRLRLRVSDVHDDLDIWTVKVC